MTHLYSLFPMPTLDEVTAMDTSTSYLMKLSLAIFGPVLIISALAFVVMFMMRRTHHKRLLATRNKQDPETYYAGDDFRATSAGDSTLRVNGFGAWLSCLLLHLLV